MRYLVTLIASCMICTTAYATLQSMTAPGFLAPDSSECPQATGFSSSVLDGAGDAVAFIFEAPKTGSITKLGFQTRTVTTGDTVDVRLETVSATNGNPSGTLCTTNSNASQAILATDDNVWFTTTLTAGCSVTAETFYAIVINAPAGWTTGNMQIATIPTSSLQQNSSPPYLALNTGVGYTKSSCVNCIFYAEYSDGSAGLMHGFPVSAIATTSYNSGSAIDERGNIFRFPFPVKVIGIWAEVSQSAGGDGTALLYDANGTTVLESVAIDGDINSGTAVRFKNILFTNEITLLANTNYRVTWRPDTTTANSIGNFTVNTASFLDAMSMGQNMYTTTRVDAGAWTNTTTTRECIGLIISGADDSAGSTILYDTTLYDVTLN